MIKYSFFILAFTSTVLFSATVPNSADCQLLLQKSGDGYRFSYRLKPSAANQRQNIMMETSRRGRPFSIDNSELGIIFSIKEGELVKSHDGKKSWKGQTLAQAYLQGNVLNVVPTQDPRVIHSYEVNGETKINLKLPLGWGSDYEKALTAFQESLKNAYGFDSVMITMTPQYRAQTISEFQQIPNSEDEGEHLILGEDGDSVHSKIARRWLSASVAKTVIDGLEKVESLPDHSQDPMIAAYNSMREKDIEAASKRYESASLRVSYERVIKTITGKEASDPALHVRFYTIENPTSQYQKAYRLQIFDESKNVMRSLSGEDKCLTYDVSFIGHIYRPDRIGGMSLRGPSGANNLNDALMALKKDLTNIIIEGPRD